MKIPTTSRSRKIISNHVAAVGAKIFVTGFRGEWDCQMWVKFSDGSGGLHSVRSHPLSEGNNFEFRDDARDCRNRVQQQLANGDSVFIIFYGDVYEIKGSDFCGVFSPPRSLPADMPPTFHERTS